MDEAWYIICIKYIFIIYWLVLFIFWLVLFIFSPSHFLMSEMDDLICKGHCKKQLAWVIALVIVLKKSFVEARTPPPNCYPVCDAYESDILSQA